MATISNGIAVLGIPYLYWSNRARNSSIVFGVSSTIAALSTSPPTLYFGDSFRAKDWFMAENGLCLMRLTLSWKPSGRSLAFKKSRKSCFTLALETTAFLAKISSPPCRITPLASPPSTLTAFTGLDTLIVPPLSFMQAASLSVRAPEPPCGQAIPQA